MSSATCPLWKTFRDDRDHVPGIAIVIPEILIN
jgi:hypothetical protein